jgi:hypothetical protein
MTDRTEGPSAEQEVEHLAGQCATLLRENERLRSVLSDIWQAWTVDCVDGDNILARLGERIKAALDGQLTSEEK